MSCLSGDDPRLLVLILMLCLLLVPVFREVEVNAVVGVVAAEAEAEHAILVLFARFAFLALPGIECFAELHVVLVPHVQTSRAVTLLAADVQELRALLLTAKPCLVGEPGDVAFHALAVELAERWPLGPDLERSIGVRMRVTLPDVVGVLVADLAGFGAEVLGIRKRDL